MNNIQKYHNYFIKSRYDISNFRKPKFSKNKKNIVYDKLFFNFLNIIKHKDLTPFYNKNIEKNIKLNISQDLDNYKFKSKEKIIEKISYEDNIDLSILETLCMYYKVNMIYWNNNIYFKMFFNTTNTNYYIVNQNCDIYCCKFEKIEYIENNFYEIKNIQKPINSLSYYKVDDIKAILNSLSINYEDKMKKSELYEMMNKYINSCIINI